MAENLKVNAKTKILEFKRKHNLLIDKIGITEDGNINFDGDLAVDGKITGNSIIENMSGYSFAEGDVNAGLTKEYIYAGAVKNGNKLTLVIAMNLTRTDEVSAFNIGSFTLPTSIMSKIYPSRVGEYDYVSVGTTSAWSSDASSKELQIYSLKSENIIVQGNTVPVNALTLNTKYYCRWELTLLLSDNLIPQE